MMIPPSIVLLLSGGLDSTTLLYELVGQGNRVHAVLFNYGQRHLKELNFARHHCTKLGVKWTDVELAQVKNLFMRCALTDGQSENVIVPNRNAIMLNIAVGIAVSNGAELVCYASNREDREMFVDCRPNFVTAMNDLLAIQDIKVEVCAPFSPLSKQKIVEIAKTWKVPIEETWSCYQGEAEPCGKCDACRLRTHALKL